MPAKRKRPPGGGAADLRRLGLVALLVKLTPEERDLIHLAAATAPRVPANQFVAAAALSAARRKVSKKTPPENSE